MAQMLYRDLNEYLRLSLTSRAVSETGNLLDPDALSVIVKSPSGTKTTYTYGTDSEIERDAVGMYELHLQMDAIGIWLLDVIWQWTTTPGYKVESVKVQVDPLSTT